MYPDDLIGGKRSNDWIATTYELPIEVIEYYCKIYGKKPTYYLLDCPGERKMKDKLKQLERLMKFNSLKYKICE